ncbi:MAG TPA: hypothetical protein PLX04_06735 [Caldisericia bacterium]|nr:hypothetical protein [Caldisericia bacterium]HPL89927.1 hypothetical protein [Caldisericia bacterium]HQG60261.1 hypothetical protein [Caldisericia bacterium]HQH49052.1 hypothetical protein [Caldisericia bacterium]HQJ44205.1 hypothetical protein [Caldisericia bacterium]
MGKNALTKWLVITSKDFKTLFKNKNVLLIYSAVCLALIMLAVLVRFVLYPNAFKYVDPINFLPMFPNYMLYFVIFTSSLYLMNQGSVSFTDEHVHGTSDRLKMLGVSSGSFVAGKLFFFYLASIIQVIIFNAVCLLGFWVTEDVIAMNLFNPISNFFIYLLLWPLGMVLVAGLFYSLVSNIKNATAAR